MPTNTASTSIASSTASATSASAAPSSAAKDAEAQKRIVTHMNRDHADSLVRYLEAHTSLPSHATRNPELVSLTKDSLTIRSSGGLFPGSPAATSTIALDPPLASMAEARERLVRMDKEAARKLGKRPETVKKFVGPQGLAVRAWVAFVLFGWVINARPAHGRWLGEMLGSRDGAGEFMAAAQPYLMAFMLVAHAAEAVYAARCCRRHSLPVGSELWLKWVGVTYIEGFTALFRFKAVVEEERVRMEKAKH